MPRLTSLLSVVAVVVALLAAAVVVVLVVRPRPRPAVAPDLTVTPTAAPSRATAPPTTVTAGPTPSMPAATRQPVARPPAVPGRVSELESRAFPGQKLYLYLPKGYDNRARYRLLVVIHGYERRVEEYTDQFTDFADANGYIILSPYFPRGERFQQLGIGEDGPTVRFDQRVLGLVDEVGRTVNAETSRFDLFGFSAGGQFAHRFLYLHPERLRAVVVASPGTVTMPTDRYTWPFGVKDLDDLAGMRINLDEVRRVRILLMVGEEDTGDGNLNDSDEANRFGKTRRARASTLHDAWGDAKIGHRYVEVPGLSHTLDERIVRPATRFLGER